MNRIICIHTDDKDLVFLDGLINSLDKKFRDSFKYIKLIYDVKVHHSAIEELKKASPDDLIVFFCHGGTDYLLGHNEIANLSSGEYYSKIIHEHNIQVLTGKKILCVACDSKVRLGKMAVAAGCDSFVGFGDIKFEDNYDLKYGDGANGKEVEMRCQQIMCKVIFLTISILIETGATFEKVVPYFKLFANKECDSLLMESKSNIHIRVANFLWTLKNEVQHYGNRDTIFFKQ